jgi:hypothetical protein
MMFDDYLIRVLPFKTECRPQPFRSLGQDVGVGSHDDQASQFLGLRPSDQVSRDGRGLA